MHATRVPLVPPDSAAVLAPAFLGQPVSYASLERITAAIRLTLQQFGYPFVSAYMPPQDITASFVQIVVQLSVAAEPRVEGAKYFSADHYRSALRQPVGQPIKTVNLKADLDWLNRNSLHDVSVVAESGERPGTTALKLRVNERFPLRVTAGYNNTGSLVSAEDRVSAGFNWGTDFGLGHQPATISPPVPISPRRAPTPPTMRLTSLGATPSASAARILNSLAAWPPHSLSGRSWQTSLRCEVPLRAPAPNLTHTVSACCDKLRARNAIAKPFEALAAPISAKPSREWKANDSGLGGSVFTSQQSNRAPRRRAVSAITS